jgi:hypothetical protein
MERSEDQYTEINEAHFGDRTETRLTQGARPATGNPSSLYRGRRVPTILRRGPYRVYFFSHDLREPPHVHVDRDDRSAKFWLSPIALARNIGFSAIELRKVERFLREQENNLTDAWHDFFDR